MTNPHPTLWQRAPTRLVGDALRHVEPSALYDPFAPLMPLADAEGMAHNMSPWAEGPLLVDALVQVAQEGVPGVEAFCSQWGLLTDPGDHEPWVAFRQAAAEFHLTCELLHGGADVSDRLAPALARVYPVPVAGGVRWAFTTLAEAAQWQLVCFLADGHRLRVCEKPGCHRLFMSWGKKRFCSSNCGAAQRQRERRAREREEG